jgi:hypothetical protein
MLRRHFRIAFIASLLLLLGGTICPADPASNPAESFELRGYGVVRQSIEQLGGGTKVVTVHRFVLSDAEHAGCFASKIYSDFALTAGNTVMPLATPLGPVDAVVLGGHGLVAPCFAAGSSEVAVVTGESEDAVTKAVGSVIRATPLRQAELSHPLYMDKWDRYCLGFWTKLRDFAEDSKRKDPDDFYKWAADIGINPQVFTQSITEDFAVNDAPFEYLRRYFTKDGVKYQRVEWLSNTLDIYNRNPFLAKTANPHVATRWIYYGEMHDEPGPLHDVQNANALTEFRRLAQDPNQMALLDPDGEVGPFDMSAWGASGPVSQRAFARFLREERHLSLDEVSQRYYGQPGKYKDWEDVALPDWRTFYGWTDHSLDLAGEWRFLRDDQHAGYVQGWSQPAFDDSDWMRLHYPGDSLVYGLVTPDQPLWMRKTITVPPQQFSGRVYLSVAPLSLASVQVFLNGQLLGSLDPRFHTAHTFGQFDITDTVAQNPKLTIALRFTGGDAPNGPVFLTSKPLEEFPTSDPLLNARRCDAMEFVDWCAAQGVASTLSALRSVDANRPIKIHAYGMSPWGWKTVAQFGGFSHHTGSGPDWAYLEPHQLALGRDLQDSSETGGSVDDLRGVKGLFGNLIFMGKNAFDYFHDLMSITKDPATRAWFEQKIPAIKIMGRAYSLSSPIAEMKGYLNWHYLGETARWEAWRHDVDIARGGEMIPFLDELRIGEDHLNRYAAIIDPGTQCWSESEAAALQRYVEAGGVLVLNNLSGESTFLQRGNGFGPGAILAGVHLGAAPASDATIQFVAGPAAFADLSGKTRNSPRFGVPSHILAPQAGVEVLGVWTDGSPAFTRRNLGKGAVYFCGGSTYPSEVVAAMAKTYGPKEFVTVDKGGGVDLIRTLRSNNGCEDLLMLRGLGNKPATVHWTFEYAPESIYDPVTGQPISAQIDGHTATFTVQIPDWDFSWFAARRPGADAAFSHWFTRQTQMWSGYQKPGQAPEAPLFRHLDLNHHWKIAQTDSREQARKILAVDDQRAGFVPTELLPWNTTGMNLRTGPGLAGVYRQEFDLPTAWTRESKLTLELCGRMLFGNYYSCWTGRNVLYVNGSKIWDGDKIDQESIDVTSLLKPVGNRFEILHEGGGIMGSIALKRSAIPDSTIDLSGAWHAVDGQQQERDVSLPGKVKSAFVYRDIEVPDSAKGQDVWLRVEGTCTFAVVNGRVRYWDTERPRLYAESPVCEINISPDIRPGQVNRIILGTDALFHGWKSQDLHYDHLELALYHPGKWSADGVDNRSVLTAGELRRVAEDLGTTQVYPMIHHAVAKPALPLAATGTLPPVLPPPIFDLDLRSSNGAVVDRGPSQIPVSISGTVEPFSESGGGPAGIYLHHEGATPSGLSISSPTLSKTLEGNRFTVRTWLRPMAANTVSQAILGSSPLRWAVSGDSSVVWMGLPFSRKLSAGNVLTPHAWQSLVLAVDRPQATLYVNGILVAVQNWGAPFDEGNPLITIGSNALKSDFLDAQLGAFTIYGDRLTDGQIGAQYLAEKPQFLPDSPPLKH